jgi:tRNA-dihydrouridine synthase A
LEQTQEQLQLVDAVMIGRAAYDNPWMFASVDNRFLRGMEGMEGMEGAIPSRIEVAEKMVVYIEEQMAKGHRMLSITRHMLQLFAGQPGARIWRRIVGEASANAKPQLDVIVEMIRQYREEQTNDLVESESH